MKITAIETKNFIGARSVDVKLTRPVALFAGRNYAGKSSVQEAVRMALTGESVRVALKKDYKQLVSDGADVGYAVIDYDGNRAAVTLPNGAHEITGASRPPAAISFVLDAQRFARLSDNDRRQFLFGLMGLETDGDAVTKRLLSRKCDAVKVEQIAPFLRAGFDAAQKEAASKARESKACWKAATGGETYGAVKAGSWKALKPDESLLASAGSLERVRRDIATVEAEIEAETIKLGAAEAREKKSKDQAGKVAELRINAGRFARVQDKLNKDEVELKGWQAKVDETRAKAEGTKSAPCACPECGAVLAWRNGELLPRDVEKTADPEAVASLPKYEDALRLMQNSVANGKRDLAAAESAARALAEIEAEGAGETLSGDAEALRVRVDTLKQRRATHQAEARKLEDAERHAEAADNRTTTAAAHHASVQAWEVISEALSPEGIPGEMLSEALGPLNERLAWSGNTSQWLRINIGRDMSIFAAEEGQTKRPYALLSESEKWRADAMIAEAVSHFSGVKILVLDRFDVLDLDGRADLLCWLDALASDGEIDTALIFGTLKAIPAQLPESVSCFWIEDGASVSLKEAA